MSMLDFNDEDDAPSLEAQEEQQLRRRREFQYSTQALLAVEPAENICIKHAALQAALAALDRTFQLATVSTMPQGVMVVGDCGTGKTLLTRLFRESLPANSLFERGAGAVIVRLQARPSQARLIASLLRQLHYPLGQLRRPTIAFMKDIVIDTLRQKGTRICFVDEAHNLCGSRRVRPDDTHGTEVTELLRELMDETRLALVPCGTPMLDDIRELDRHLHSRIPTRIELKNFFRSELQGFLMGASQRLPSYDFAAVLDRTEVQRWHVATSGNPRAVKRLLVECLLVATDAGKRKIDRCVAEAAFRHIAGPGSMASNPFHADRVS